jgi:hypothetical protein
MTGNRDNLESPAHRRADFGYEASNWLVGWGLIIMVLFPLALPLLVLTAIFFAPLALLPLAAALVAAAIAAPVILLRRVGRRVFRSRRAGAGSPRPKGDRNYAPRPRPARGERGRHPLLGA